MAIDARPSEPHPPVVLTTDGKEVELRLTGELDLAHAAELEAVAAALRPKPGQTILVDLTTATFVDSTVISWLVGIANRAAEARADVVLRAGPGAVRRVLEISGVTRYIPLAEDAVQPAIRLPAGSDGA